MNLSSHIMEPVTRRGIYPSAWNGSYSLRSEAVLSPFCALDFTRNKPLVPLLAFLTFFNSFKAQIAHPLLPAPFICSSSPAHFLPRILFGWLWFSSAFLSFPFPVPPHKPRVYRAIIQLCTDLSSCLVSGYFPTLPFTLICPTLFPTTFPLRVS